jgi:hypothetical protein
MPQDVLKGGPTRLQLQREDRAERYLARVQSIRTFNAQETGELAFMAQPLVQLTLPHSDPGDVVVYERINGDHSLIVQPGMIRRGAGAESAGIPFGTYPRLILAWVTTEALRTNSPSLLLGPSLAAFMDDIGLSRGGRTRELLRDQMRRLFAANIAVVRRSEGLNQSGFRLTSEARLWWDHEALGEAVGMDSRIRLSDEFFRIIVERPVPLDVRVLQVLKESPLGLDLYMWATYRVSYARREVVVSWDQLHAQVGASYKTIHEFARAAKRELRRIKLVWPRLDYATPRGRLVLRPGTPHVNRKLMAG